MALKSRFARLIGGLALVAAVVVIGFALLPGWIHTNGATVVERQDTYPGDDWIAAPVVSWQHALTIDAPPDEVWPWVAQLGDSRGGFYSYTFIENAIAGFDQYHNSNRILPEMQNPQPGTPLITGVLEVKEVEPGRYLLGGLSEDGMFTQASPGMKWSWLWYLEPLGTDQTRLVVHMDIGTPPEAKLPAAATLALDAGGWVMERRMLDGIRLRAEGGQEPAWLEPAEIGVWLLALLVGLAAAVKFVTQQAWRRPLLVGLLAVVALFWFAFVQPPFWLRAAIDLALLAAVALPARRTNVQQQAVQPAGV